MDETMQMRSRLDMDFVVRDNDRKTPGPINGPGIVRLSFVGIDRCARQTPLEVIEERDRIERSVGHVEHDEFELHVFARHDWRFGREPFRRAAVVRGVHSSPGKFAITRGTRVTTFGYANVEETVVDRHGIVESVERNVLIGRNSLRPRLQERKVEVVVLGAAVNPVFIRDELELVRERLRIGRGANRETNVRRIVRARTSGAISAATCGSRKGSGVRREVRCGGIRDGQIVGIGAERSPRIIEVSHESGRQTGHRGAFFGHDTAGSIIHQNRRLLILDRCQLTRTRRIAIGEQLIRRYETPFARSQWRILGRVLAEFNSIGDVDARDPSKLGRGTASCRRRDVRSGGIAIIVQAIAHNFISSRIDEPRVGTTLQNRIATIAITHWPAVAISIAGIISGAIAIFIHAIGTHFGPGQNLPHTRAPTSPRGITRLSTTFARSDVLGPRRPLITRFRHSRNAGACSLLQNIPFTAVHRVLVAIGVCR